MAKGKVTSFDIAHLAGVSQPTVSCAREQSTGQRSHSAKGARDRCQAELQGRQECVQLRCQHSETLALLLFEDENIDDSFINPFFHAMLASITRACAARGL